MYSICKCKTNIFKHLSLDSPSFFKMEAKHQKNKMKNNFSNFFIQKIF